MNKKIIGLIIISLVLIPSVALAATDWGFSFGLSSGDGGSSYSSGGGGWSVGNVMGYGLPSGSITGILGNILLWILRIFGILGVIGFVISGILYLTSAGDEDRMQAAKRAMFYSIIGVIVGLMGVVIIQAVNYALNNASNF
jgi:hypothetical protein